MRKGFAITLAAVGTAACIAIYALSGNQGGQVSLYSNTIDATEQDFMNFVSKYRKSYGTKEEYNYRLNIYRKALKVIDAKNAEGHAVHAVNKFADMSPSEFNKLKGYKKQARKTKPVRADSADPVQAPASVDWRKLGGVTPVKD